MDEAKLRTVAQLQEFLNATQEIKFTGAPEEGDHQRYEHISRVLKRFAYSALGKGARGVVLAYLRRTSRTMYSPGFRRAIGLPDTCRMRPTASAAGLRIAIERTKEVDCPGLPHICGFQKLRR